MHLDRDIRELLDQNTGLPIEHSSLRVTEQSVDDRAGEHVVKLEYRFRLHDREISERFVSEIPRIVDHEAYRASLMDLVYAAID